MGFLDKAKKLAERAGPLLDKAAPHARTAVDKAGEQIDKRTGGKYHDKIEQAGQVVVDYADERMAADGTGPAARDDGFPPTPPPAATPPAATPPAATPPPPAALPHPPGRPQPPRRRRTTPAPHGRRRPTPTNPATARRPEPHSEPDTTTGPEVVGGRPAR